ncbi:putative kinetochore protein [Podospora fimiseda]|uniref:Kinetochore protein n=1 Tax=Podospora fimiseda TaxID=252190 RepID=A0AAN7BP28_9PEZI|nr:putative kinetochore protein [Podospora fimiseda]
MTSSQPPTIISLKQSFLQSQTRLLSQPFQPTRAWRTQNTRTDSPLPEKAIDDALYKLNHLLSQHSRRVYAPQATRHVAEQIDALYLTFDSSLNSSSSSSPSELTTSTDLADPEIISSLPLEWESSTFSEEEETYKTLVKNLQNLSQQRESLQTRLAKLRGLQKLLEPFTNNNQEQEKEDEALNNHVQENLVTRNGEIEKELEKMRMLLARVGGRIGGMLRDGSNSDRMDLDEDDEDHQNEDWERKKLEGVLNSF